MLTRHSLNILTHILIKHFTATKLRILRDHNKFISAI